MKKYILIILLVVPTFCFAQLPGLIPFTNTAVDTLVVKGRAYPVEIVGETTLRYQYYLIGDESKTLRTIDTDKVDNLIRVSSRDKKASVLDPESLIGKEIYIQVSPFKPALSSYWQVVIDDGINGNWLLTSPEGDKIKFFSEMAIVNYLIGRGWNLHKIQLVEKGSVGGASSFLETAAIGGKITISSNVYFFKRIYKKDE